MITVRDLEWAAGFLEGEGCFYSGSTRLSKDYVECTIRAAQVQKQPLLRLQNIFKRGHISFQKARRFTHSDSWVWSVQAKTDVISIAMTLYTLMSLKRKEQIRKLIGRWRAWGRAYEHVCPKGHPRSESYYYTDATRTYRFCRSCRKERRHVYYVRKGK